MAIYKCKVCAGTLEVSENQTTATCNYCGVEQTLPKLNNELIVNLYDRANHFRRNNEFDKAEKLYEQIILEDYTDSEAYWSLLLCKYGIEYVEDVKTGKRIPTVNKTQYVSIFDDANYKKAIEYADSYQKEIYERDASTINEIQKKIITISQKEDPYDIFISYKETDEQGRRTRDSVMANELYHQLANEGYKVFFSRITLEKKLGTEYEPYIFAALNSAKVMIVIGTKPEFFNAVWVRNEWSRFLNIVKDSKGSKILIPAYRDMDPYDLPEEFSHLQAQDMNKLGFVQDIIHGIKKIVKKDKPKEQIIGTVSADIGGNVAGLLRRVDLFLEESDWENAELYCERILDIDAENAEAYLRKLLIDYKLKTKSQLKEVADRFGKNTNYLRILRFDPNNLGAELQKYVIDFEQTQLEKNYQEATKLKEEQRYDEAYRIFNTISDYKDSSLLAAECLKLDEIKSTEDLYKYAEELFNSGRNEKTYLEAAERYKNLGDYLDSVYKHKESIRLAEIARKESIYIEANKLIQTKTISSLRGAIVKLKSIKDYKDSEQKINEVNQLLESIKQAEKDAERKRVIKLAKIWTPIIVGIITLVILTVTVFTPSSKLKKAISLMEQGRFNEAREILSDLNYSNSKKYYKITLAHEKLSNNNYEDAEKLIYDVGGTVTYTHNYNGGKNNERSSTVKQPTPERIGYSFSHWNIETFVLEFKNTVSLSVRLKASYSPNSNTNYQVNYYLENLNDNNYSLEETIGYSGVTDERVSAYVKDFHGFVSPNHQEITINPDGNTTVNYYYKRVKINISFVTNGGNNISSKSVKYGETINQIPSNGSLTFGGWYSNMDLTQLYNQAKVNDVTLYAHWLEENKPSDFNYEVLYNGIKITNYKGNNNEVVVPKEIGGTKVTEIGKAFVNKFNILSIIIPNTVENIELGAFKGVNSLESITLPFVGKNRTVYDYVPSMGAGETGGVSLFGYIFGSEFRNGVVNDEENLVYQGQSSLSNYRHHYIPSSLKHIVITDQTGISTNAFYNMKNLQSVKLPDGVKDIHANAFRNNTNLISANIPSDIVTIGSYAFYNTDLSSITLPSTLKTIGNYAFYNNDRINSLTLNNGLQSIGNYAFENLSITSLVVPNTVNDIGLGAFKGMNSLQSITLPFVGKTRTVYDYLPSMGAGDSGGISLFGYIFGSEFRNGIVSNEENLVFQGQSSLSNYRHHYIPSSLKHVVITDQTGISTNAFYNMVNVETIKLPNSIVNIYNNAFRGTSNVTIYIPSSANINYSANWNPNNRPIIYT